MRTKFHNYKQFKEVAFNPENKYKLSPDFDVEDGILYFHIEVYNKNNWYLFDIHTSPDNLFSEYPIVGVFVDERCFEHFTLDYEKSYERFLMNDKNFQTFIKEKFGKYKNILSKTQWVHSVPIYYDLNENEERYEHCECFCIDWDDEKEDAFLDSYEMF